MTSKERVKRAIHFRCPDRMPHYLPDGAENDLLWLWPARPPERMPWTSSGGHDRRIDEWGVTWERSQKDSMGEAVAWPITDLARHADYRFPDLNDLSCLAEIRAAIDADARAVNPKYALGVMPFNSLNEGTHNLIGLQAMLLAYYEQPAALKSFLARLAAQQRISIQRLAECGCDGVMGYDDWGLQDRLMIGMDLIDEFFLPLYRENWALAHDHGLDVWLHSCGYTIELLPRLIDAGLDVIQMDQQENMGLENLDRTVGGRLAFWCPVDIQQTMVHGSCDDIRTYVERMKATLGRHNGGLVSMAYSSPEAVHHAPEKTAAMCAAFRGVLSTHGQT